MRTVKILLALAVVATFTASAVAQDAQKKKGANRINSVTQVMMRLEKLREALEKMDLTEQQQAKLSKIREGIKPKMTGIMEQLTQIIGQDKMREAAGVAQKAKEAGKAPRQVATAVEASLKLTDEQKEKMAKVGKEMSTIQRGLLKEVNGMLTAEQKEKLKAAMVTRNRGKNKKKDK